MPAFDYQTYLASREWAVRREAVRKRSGDRCERTLNSLRCPNPHESTHHLTYARIGREPIEDLMAVCNDCHRWLSGKTTVDPLALNTADEPLTLKIRIGSYEPGNEFRTQRLRSVARYLALSLRGRPALGNVTGLYDHKGSLTVFASCLPDERTRITINDGWEGCSGIADWWEPKETIVYCIRGRFYDFKGRPTTDCYSSDSMTTEEEVAVA